MTAPRMPWPLPSLDYTMAELEALPTLCTGQADSLKIEEPSRRVWVSRCEPGIVEIETLGPEGWRTTHRGRLA